MVEVRWVASGFISRKGMPEPACRTIAVGHSSWKYTGSRAGLLAGQACRIPHAAQSRARAQRGSTLGRERVYQPERHAETRMLRNHGPALTVETPWVASRTIRRTGAQVHACRTIADSRTPQKYTLRHEQVYRPDMYAATRMRHNRGLALTVEIHRASSVCNSGYPRPIRHYRPSPRAPSPLKTTARRVVRDAGYPHACASTNAMADARRGRCDRPAILAGKGSSADRVLPLTVEMHSVASRFGDRISTRGLALAPLVRSRPNRTCTPRRTEPLAKTIASCRADQRSRIRARRCIAQCFESFANAARRSEICTLQTTHPHSPLKCTAFRVTAGTGSPRRRTRAVPPSMRAFG